MNNTIDNPEADARLKNVNLNIRACFVCWDIANSTVLREMLEISTQRARDLWAGRKRFTLHELELVSAFFDVSIVSWFEDSRPVVSEWRTSGRETAVIGRAWDRLVTEREMSRHI
ncbi:hypothetical protein [Agrococcus sp. ProA11]|uniref:hypothetical protein n=1 Tax=Agrococcus chionoecetis TaxID=3153752 RepID=UPI003260BB5D